MNSAPPPAGNGEPGTAEKAPVLLMAKAETVAEPELLMKAKAIVCPGDISMLPIIPPQPAAITNAQSREAERKTTKMCCERGKTWCADEIMGASKTGQTAPQNYRPRSTPRGYILPTLTAGSHGFLDFHSA